MPNIKANLTNVNYNSRGTDPRWIVIHNTANGTSAEGTAYNNTVYFKNTMRNASAHYFIDDGDTIWQCVPETDTAWHVGEAPSRNGCYNTNSIGIEVCESSSGWFTEKEISNLRWLVQDLMDRYDIPESRLTTHHLTTGKNCPWRYSDADNWAELKAQILGDDLDMANAQEFAEANYHELMDAWTTEDKTKQWGQSGKGGGALYANGYNIRKWNYLNIAELNKTLKSINTTLAAINKKLV